MRRQIIILAIALLCAVALWADTPQSGCPECPECEACCTSITFECEGPPWSGGCDLYTCGEIFQLGYLHDLWQRHNALNLVVHSEGSVELLIRWVPVADAEIGHQLGSRSITLDGGNYSIPFANIMANVFDSENLNHWGSLWLEWRACGESYLYLDGWLEIGRGRASQEFITIAGFGQRTYLHQETLCPTAHEVEVGGVCTQGRVSKYIQTGCYEAQIPPGTEFVRTQFLNLSGDLWQVLYVDGHRVDVPPLLTEWPQTAGFNFLPSSDLITICVGREDPWSIPIEYSDECVLGTLEVIDTETRRRLSIPIRPKIFIE